MSLLTGMNSMFENTAAMEAANDELIFEEMLALESDDLIDTLADGIGPYDDVDLDEMVDDDLDDDELDEEVEAEECGDLTGKGACSACEAAALTGNAFLSHLVRDTNDPIKTKPGSIGQQSSAASFDGNFSDEYDDDNDPITTKPGSIGLQSSAANHSDNFSDESQNVESRAPRRSGSFGQKTSVAKDPSMESFTFLSNLVRGTSTVSDVAAEATSRYAKETDLLGLEPLDNSTISALIDSGNTQEALEQLSSYYDEVQAASVGIDMSDTQDPTVRAIHKLSVSIESMIMWAQATKMRSRAMESGSTSIDATRSVINAMKTKANAMKQNGELTPVTESAIHNTLSYLGYAMEADACCDPEATEDGSVGQDTSKAHSGDNFSNGILDSMDPIQTRDGSEGQQDSAATFDRNHSGGMLDTMDPVHTDDGSVGQKDSTAKDPAAEAMTTLEKLEELTRSLEDME